MQLVIDFQDYEGNSHGISASILEDQTTIIQLKAEICSNFNIEAKYQQIFHDDRRIDILDFDSTLSQIGLKHMDKVIVRHSLIPTWNMLKQIVSTFEETNARDELIELASDIISNADDLRKSKFFDVYPEYGIIYYKNWSKYYKLIDRIRYDMEKAARSYFEEFYFELQNVKAEVGFAEKEGGSRSGVIVIVDHSQGVTRYYLKTDHEAGIKTSACRHPPNLKELFAYKLLELIGIGPIVHFPDNSHTTVFLVFIATEEVQGLKLIKELRDEELTNGEFRLIVREKVVQAYLISLLLGLADLNEENFGLDNKNNLSIFDFWINNDTSRSADRSFAQFFQENNFGLFTQKRCLLLREANEESRRMIAKESLKCWNISENLALANEYLISTKYKFRAHGVKFTKGTEDLDEYINSITEKLSVFESL